MSASSTAAQPGAGWDEAQCMAALAQLEQLQAQVRTFHLNSVNGTKLYRLMIYASQYLE